MPDKSGYVIFLYDDKKLGAIKVMGARDLPITPLQTMAWFKAPRLDVALKHVWDELREYRITGNWYVKDAVEMYLDNRQGRA